MAIVLWWRHPLVPCIQSFCTSAGDKLPQQQHHPTSPLSPLHICYCLLLDPLPHNGPNDRLAVRIKTKLSVVRGPNLPATPNYMELISVYAVHTFPIAHGVCPTIHIHITIKLWILTSALPFIFKVILQLTTLNYSVPFLVPCVLHSNC